MARYYLALKYWYLSSLILCTSGDREIQCQRRCDYDRHYRVADCSELGLTCIPSHEGCSAAVTLDLSENIITSLTNGSFTGFPVVKYLDLSSNSISDVQHGSFHGLHDILTVDLSQNQISVLHESIFIDVASTVRQISLDRNRITSINEVAFQNLNKLSTLFLHHNQIQELPPAVFSNLTALESLYINSNGLKCLPSSLLESQERLIILDLSHNELVDILNIKFTFPIRTTILAHNKLQDIPLPTIPLLNIPLPDSCPLRTLDVRHNSISDATNLTHYINVTDKLLIDHNPFRCEYSLDSIREWIQEDEIARTTSELSCLNVSTGEEVLVRNLSPTDTRYRENEPDHGTDDDESGLEPDSGDTGGHEPDQDEDDAVLNGPAVDSRTTEIPQEERTDEPKDEPDPDSHSERDGLGGESSSDGEYKLGISTGDVTKVETDGTILVILVVASILGVVVLMIIVSILAICLGQANQNIKKLTVAIIESRKTPSAVRRVVNRISTIRSPKLNNESQLDDATKVEIGMVTPKTGKEHLPRKNKMSRKLYDEANQMEDSFKSPALVKKSNEARGVPDHPLKNDDHVIDMGTGQDDDEEDTEGKTVCILHPGSPQKGRNEGLCRRTPKEDGSENAFPANSPSPRKVPNPAHGTVDPLLKNERVGGITPEKREVPSRAQKSLGPVPISPKKDDPERGKENQHVQKTAPRKKKMRFPLGESDATNQTSTEC